MINQVLSQDLNNYKEAPLVNKNEKDIEKARKSAEDFEAFFVSQMFQHMYSGIEPDSEFGGGNAEKVWQSMLIDEYGKMTVKSGGIGIADKLMDFMLKTQEV